MDIDLRIQKTIQDTYINGDYKKILGQKYEGNNFKNWQLKMTGELLGGEIIRDDTTGFNPSFTSFIHFKKEQSNNFTKSICFFFLRKSILGDYITSYGIIRTTLIFSDEKINYPGMFVASPIGPYSTLFKKGFALLKQKYPTSIYLNFGRLMKKIDVFTLPGEKESTVYDLIFGKYEEKPKLISGNIYYNPSRD